VDNITHTLFAVTLGRTRLARAGRGATAVLVVASNAPDIDILATAGGGAKYLEWHRGLTHGPLGLAGLGLLSAAIVYAARNAYHRHMIESVDAAPWPIEEHASFAMLTALAFIGVVFHVLMDLPTAYGIRLFSPFTWRWFGVDWMPIMDLYLLIVLMAGLLFARPTAAAAGARQRNAAIVLTLMAVNYGVRGYAHHRALEIAPRLFGPTLPQPCDAAPRQPLIVDSWPQPVPAPPPDGHRCLVELAAIPTFTSPFDWRIVAQMSNAFEIHDLNLLDARFAQPGDDDGANFWRQVLRYPNVWTPAVHEAAKTRVGQLFLGFSRFPAARTAVDATGATTVRFTDVRFVGGAFGPDGSRRRVQLFTVTIRFDSSGRLISAALGP